MDALALTGPQRPASSLQQEKPKRACPPECAKNFRKTAMCRYYPKCMKGSACPWAHSPHELRLRPNFTKTRMCAGYYDGRCRRPSHECSFAHGQHELRAAGVVEMGNPKCVDLEAMHINLPPYLSSSLRGAPLSTASGESTPPSSLSSRAARSGSSTPPEAYASSAPLPWLPCEQEDLLRHEHLGGPTLCAAGLFGAEAGATSLTPRTSFSFRAVLSGESTPPYDVYGCRAVPPPPPGLLCDRDHVLRKYLGGFVTGAEPLWASAADATGGPPAAASSHGRGGPATPERSAPPPEELFGADSGFTVVGRFSL